MSSTKDRVRRARYAILKPDPWTSGTLEVEPDQLRLFYLDQKKHPQPHLVTLNTTTPSFELDLLASSCHSLSHDDAANRSASPRSLEKEDYSPLLDLQESRLIYTIVPQLVRGKDADRVVCAERSKLYICGRGADLDGDTERSRNGASFATLHIIYPTTFEGGEFLLKDNSSRPFIFEPAKELTYGPSNQVAFVAFFHNVECQAYPVKSGHCITLVYDLCFADRIAPPLPATTSDVEALHRYIGELYRDPQFLLAGGFLAFGMQYAYPVEDAAATSLSDVMKLLKGSDRAVRIACTDLGLGFSVRGILEDQETGSLVLLARLVDLADYPGEVVVGEGITLDRLLTSGSSPPGEIVQLISSGELDSTMALSRPNGVVWVAPLTKHTTYQTSYISRPHRSAAASIQHVQVHLCLVAAIPPFKDRARVDPRRTAGEKR